MPPENVQKQIRDIELQKKMEKEEKKKAKKMGKRAPSPTFDPKKEDDLDRQAEELAAKIASTRMSELGEWKAPGHIELKDRTADGSRAKEIISQTPAFGFSDEVPLSAKSGAHSQL